MSLIRLIARPLLASSFVYAGLERLRKPLETSRSLEPNLRRVSSLVPQASTAAEHPVLMARIIGGVQVGAGILLALGKAPRTAALLLVGTSAVTAVSDSAAQTGFKDRSSSLLKNLSLVGAVLLAAADTAGKPSLAWRTQHLGKDAGRQLRKSADEAVKTAQKVIKK
ncbi:DoxX family protein [Paeniglutamicibacter cryotolerans]|uniref:Putative membrane protein YphA (DoxX/SURF4 family) n=1 Tax=Paeniglutamicibacter cryotolerans TaxID=670079 RepID=A0A839QKJ0_9MICC|nr:DoxX family protein [Paeniglutamicibacter cryotolerans]MBB2996340.1 putative membrane protein YphA (DoxX/SURF4 family) [Paeniglutamicibacter cryotolerans]